MKKFLICFLVFALSLSPFMLKTNEEKVYAKMTSARAMCVLEKDSKRVLYAENEHEHLAMASTTKVMTAITVLENCDDLTQMVEVDNCAVGVSGTSIYLRQGEILSVKDLLYGLMLRSGNDSATALACYVGGDVKTFAEKMTELAHSIGAKDSQFKNPHGLDTDGHYTTAYNLALITAYALNNPIFKEIVSTKNYVIEATNKSEKRYLTNKNKLLSTLDGCCGVKTGFTNKAGRCLVSAITRNETTYVCVVLNDGPMFEDSKWLLNKADAEYKNLCILDKDKEIFNEYIIDETHGRLYLYVDEDFYYPLKEAEIEKLKLEYNVTLDDAKEGDCVGEIKVFLDKHLIKVAKLYTMNKIDKLIDSKTLNISEILWEEKVNENQ